MSQMGIYLQSPNSIVTKQLMDQGLMPYQGLGISNQGYKKPIQPCAKIE